MRNISEVLAEIDQINKQDPRREAYEGVDMPKEYVYSLRMTEMMDSHYPEADELLKIAARGQHIKRWVIPRDEYPMDRKGYLQWRTKLKLMHGQLLTEIMQRHGYSIAETKKVADLVAKKKLHTDENAQKLEDIVCLVFLKYYFDDFAKQHPEEKVVDILRKTWKKMSEKGKEMAMELKLSEGAQRLIGTALSS
ncbi:hypothetical protein C900_02718 [Fulvivirga imtechensis AK7]|uniref:DUF4202 domain-containing protein n=1 Tax=Fulvivirga imtechensis AK7 TaxID=1237149 RepID=L8JVX0_9BACT|nr:DUF4202 domain-containing protein [Fulvivirga imtechensis]ELR71377.1 hypothetical protein C900_02718 [Fulvivirga imtechensis AK7]